MKKHLLKESTYCRWQKYGTLYGLSRYSLVALTNMNARGFIDVHMRTIYSRMFELVILQRASMLRFSGEVTKVSALKGNDNKKLSERIASLYKEYIRFINQIYFRSVTTQDQGIEMYEMLLRQFDSASQIKDLDEEISELHQYVSLMIDQRRNEDGETLNIMAAIFLPATLLSGIFGMNPFGGNKEWISLGAQVLFITIVTITTSVFLCRKILKNRRK
jgi:Mg2+ and Co2+ transporter CorA